MRDLGTVMDSLRMVRQARRRFMQMWRVERDVINPMLDRMADDLQDVTVPGNVATGNDADDDDDDPGRDNQPPPALPGD
jgi:hypothetical protein